MKHVVLSMLRILFFLFAGLLVLLAAFLVFMTLTEYHPGNKEILAFSGTGLKTPPSDTLTFLTWNIGYSGLGKDMDFFYEGGRRVRPDREEFNSYLTGILKLIRSNDTLDFLFIQEADRDSKRSYRTDEVKEIAETANHCTAYAANYQCRFVPLPVSSPMGRVNSGIVTLSRYEPSRIERISFSSSFGWPTRLFFLKRCFMVLVYPLANGKDLVVINTHNSTFDQGGELRKVELKELGDFAAGEYEKGNYVIIGGDWNNNPPGFSARSFRDGNLAKIVVPPIEENFLPGWHFATDLTLPTNRDVDIPFRKGLTKTTIIDFFVMSPNLEALSVRTLETDFAWSDHQPVILKVCLRSYHDLSGK
ncbi:MAG TPA: endonuclease/exonuclease/phosphatase family protein [Bacteroidales bacterium]|nr:endonuclease/exonuclease/phosphatase family protein [Bacteroidales bacterium]